MTQQEEQDRKPLTLSREDLYELVWSKPLRELAKDFDISDVALAKRCRRLGIPLPGRGYWARLDAGQEPYRPKLPQRERQWSDEAALTVGPPQGHSTALDDGDPEKHIQSVEDELAAARRDDLWIKARLAFEDLPTNRIEVPEISRNWDAAVQECRDHLEEAAKKLRASKKASDEYDKWPDWRKRKEPATDAYEWRSVQDRGQRLSDTHRAVCFRVSLGTYKRALSVVNALALAARSRGFAVRNDEEAGRLVFAGHSAEVQLRVTEQLEQKTRPRERYDGKIEQKKYQVPTGRLRITLQGGYAEGPTFEDSASRPLDSQLNAIFVAIYRQVVRAWREERKQLALRQRHAHEAQKRAEAARIEAEREQAIAEERSHRRQLMSEASRWLRSKRVREYVAHIQSAAIERPQMSDTITAWIEWASRVAADLDPTEDRFRATEGRAISSKE